MRGEEIWGGAGGEDVIMSESNMKHACKHRISMGAVGR